MLLGTFVPKLDEKGRIILPAKFMGDFANGVVMTRGQERCIYLFSQREFEELHERARQAPVTGKKGRDFLRMFLSGAAEDMPDKQHRVTIPPMLREYAGLDRELTVIGAGNRAEIWDTASWNAYYEATEAAFADTDEEVIAGLF
ncbi:division/cell wall cluster transcriptional repressor MraZ [Homoserinibacter gongjuensis]|jgi:MraZ protein|uniref:Transcriptional regulator MraZ n=1 Tax=Homoserinibacter gongjuensis TaxID=1162968 RepID=A0ABQ6JZN6_9MICO|nr:division/cell wall cluster transcriptional repressor MraZ [Homoserinibacter gongjuensis]GMA92750.1 transcriptional regulator MraZ [Homoserinibacter gongjuensis]HTN59221.1 division/cell wall cluster transcriptional repressor MraZ [Protaetiibacter sp.]